MTTRKEDLTQAFTNTIHEIGIPALKESSMFLRSAKKLDDNHISNKTPFSILANLREEVDRCESWMKTYCETGNIGHLEFAQFFSSKIPAIANELERVLRYASK